MGHHDVNCKQGVGSQVEASIWDPVQPSTLANASKPLSRTQGGQNCGECASENMSLSRLLIECDTTMLNMLTK